MAFELKPGQGTLHKNDKDGVEARPDRRGELNIDGTIYELSGWIKEGKKGSWLSLSVKPKEARQETKPEPARQNDTGDDIPW